MGRSKDPILSVALPESLKARLQKCAEELDLSQNDIARHAIRAAVAEIEANGFRIEIPLRMQVAAGKPLESKPKQGGAFAAIRDAGATAISARASRLTVPSEISQRLNEEPEEGPANPNPTRFSGTRRAIKKMTARERKEQK